MKKGLLLSVVASTMIFAGGDIAPVEPAAAAPAADCSDFYGQVGAYYQSETGYYMKDGKSVESDLFSDEATNDFSVTATIGVEKEIFNGIGFGAEVAGYTTLGLDTNDNNDAHIDGPRTGTREGGELSQLYLTASFGNTAIKVGRYALPQSLSPFAWTDTTAGVKDTVFEGLVVANTDVTDTTIYGVYARNAVDGSTRTAIGKDDLGLFALGFVNKSVADTTISAVGYYLPDAAIDAAGDTYAEYAGFATVDTKFDAYKVSFQAAYVGGDEEVGTDATFAVGAKVSGNFGMFDASLAASYINDGDFALAYAGGYWLYTANEIDAQIGGYATTAILAKVGAKVGIGKLYGSLGYWLVDSNDVAGEEDNVLGARVGYKFKVAGVATKIEYRYRNTVLNGDSEDVTRNRVRIEATYKF